MQNAFASTAFTRAIKRAPLPGVFCKRSTNAAPAVSAKCSQNAIKQHIPADAADRGVAAFAISRYVTVDRAASIVTVSN